MPRYKDPALQGSGSDDPSVLVGIHRPQMQPQELGAIGIVYTGGALIDHHNVVIGRAVLGHV